MPLPATHPAAATTHPPAATTPPVAATTHLATAARPAAAAARLAAAAARPAAAVARPIAPDTILNTERPNAGPITNSDKNRAKRKRSRCSSPTTKIHAVSI